jgi:branched-chain amino acid transport system ATP-binding protein
VSSQGSAVPSAPATGEALLTVEGLTAGYAGRPVLYDVALTLRQGEVVVVLGSNGAGKTTMLKSIVGLVQPFAGTVVYAGKPWRTDRPWRAAGSGIAFIPAERYTFAGLSVDDNLLLGAYTTASGDERRERLDYVLELFPVLAARRGQLAGTMSGGEQRMLSLAVALMSGPRLLLLDEPSLGLGPAIVEQIMAAIGRLVSARGLSVLMVEQNVSQALTIADRTYVLRSGRIILEESAEETRAREHWWDLF